jgi:S-adenosylmethionine:tRNA ribosyltransferase-isomerase
VRLRVADFDYPLPAAAIAQRPAEPRDASRLLVLDRGRSASGPPNVRGRYFADLAEELRAGDLLVLNESRVMAARLRGLRDGGGAAELLLLRPADGPFTWEALVRPSRRLTAGSGITLSSGDRALIGARLSGVTRVVTFERDPFAVMAEAGEVPLPPYIHDRSSPAERYQTVFARSLGSAAAPTAGLHFSESLLLMLTQRGIRLAQLTLHVGLDTFRPLEGEFVDEHQIHTEWYELPAETSEAVAETRAAGGRVVAVGTTSLRVLESVARNGTPTGWTNLYVTPPYPFAAVDALVTNFHLPRSSLLLLVTAFVQHGMPGASAYEARDTLLAAYSNAIEEGYRFFSFGDAMLIL